MPVLTCTLRCVCVCVGFELSFQNQNQLYCRSFYEQVKGFCEIGGKLLNIQHLSSFKSQISLSLFIFSPCWLRWWLVVVRVRVRRTPSPKGCGFESQRPQSLEHDNQTPFTCSLNSTCDKIWMDERIKKRNH